MRPWRHEARAAEGSFAPRAFEVKTETAVRAPMAKTKKMWKRELAKVRAARSVTPSWPTMTVSATPSSIWLSWPIMRGSARRRVRRDSARRCMGKRSRFMPDGAGLSMRMWGGNTVVVDRRLLAGGE